MERPVEAQKEAVGKPAAKSNGVTGSEIKVAKCVDKLPRKAAIVCSKPVP